MNNPHHKSALHNVGYRLGRRKRLFEQRCLITDFSLAFAVIGIALMVIENELTMIHVYTKVSRCFLVSPCFNFTPSATSKKAGPISRTKRIAKMHALYCDRIILTLKTSYALQF